VTPVEPLGLCLDGVVALDDHSFYVRGWMRRREAELTRLTAVSPEGCRTELFDMLLEYERPDVEALYPLAQSFSCFFESSLASTGVTGWRFELEDARGEILAEPAPLVRDPGVAHQMILDDLLYIAPDDDALIRNHTFPALRRIAETQWASPTIDSIIQFGTPPVDPAVSIIVPLYGDIRLVELQLATLADDAEIAGADLIYVLDSPDLAGPLTELSAELHDLYRLPFRLVTLQRHSGYAGANNVGASLSNGRLLVLLNSDVMPRGHGWLSTMVEFYESTQQIGALGPKLLFEDDSIQHAGMYFHAPPGRNIWENAHYFKGMHSSLPAANAARAVPAVTGACLMISRDLYLDHDGLLGLYVQGDYEDSDFCLRLRRAGYDNWYLPEVELYHLEGQSYDLRTRQRNARYNVWLHTELRRDAIEEAMTEFATAAVAAPS
jgi:GT2 family glycosyltransferase